MMMQKLINIISIKNLVRFFILVLLFLYLPGWGGNKLKVKNIDNAVISLNGIWKISNSSYEAIRNAENINWVEIKVPGECQMQGFSIQHDKPFVYSRKFFVPADFKENEIYLAFHGVYSFAKLWVNEKYAGHHTGGFTTWECNITALVTAGDTARVMIEVTDPADDISYGSGYAKHQIGGILRKVELVALPAQHFRSLYYETELDDNFKNANLKVFCELSKKSVSAIKIELFDKQGSLISKTEHRIDNYSAKIAIPVVNPKKWDAEHPNLYHAVFTLSEQGQEILKTNMNVGFREIQIQGNKLMVNGQPVKLRGACRHDIHPLLGRMTTPEYDSTDVQLAKEANINFIRTSHYPPSEEFLDYCDKYGIYVEDETAVCFVGSHRMAQYLASGATQDDASYTDIYLTQLKEMVQNHRNHPSVIIWSIGNENLFGTNFVKSYQWVKANDETRPVIFSYPGQVPEDSLRIYDIVSMHYPNWRGNLVQYGIETKGFNYDGLPVLFDEWAHVACYNNEELKADPNVRNYWGQSLDSMWTNLFESEGGLGGAIWGMIDETFMLPKDLPGFNQWWGIIDPKIIPSTYVGPCVGYGEWGIIDTWRRKKPEFWNTKKAYSPTKIYQNEITGFTSGKEIKIPVHNRFDHTDFNELTIIWEYNGKSGKLEEVNLKPHQKGSLTIPGQQWNNSHPLNLYFYLNDNFLVDNYSLALGQREVDIINPEKGALTVEENNGRLIVSSELVRYSFDKTTGLFESIRIKNEPVIHTGPVIHFSVPGNASIMNSDSWKPEKFEYNLENGIASVNTSGTYDSIAVGFKILIGGNDIVQIDFKAEGIPPFKNLREAGIKLLTAKDFNLLSWDRDAYFSGYPAGHPGSSKGETNLKDIPVTEYRKKPACPWEMDTQNFYYHGLDKKFTLSNTARSLKENIWSYSLKKNSGCSVTVMSDGTQSARYDESDEKYSLIINGNWDYPSIGWGNYSKRVKPDNVMQGTVRLKFATFND